MGVMLNDGVSDGSLEGKPEGFEEGRSDGSLDGSPEGSSEGQVLVTVKSLKKVGPPSSNTTLSPGLRQ